MKKNPNVNIQISFGEPIKKVVPKQDDDADKSGTDKNADPSLPETVEEKKSPDRYDKPTREVNPDSTSQYLMPTDIIGIRLIRSFNFFEM